MVNWQNKEVKQTTSYWSFILPLELLPSFYFCLSNFKVLGLDTPPPSGKIFWIRTCCSLRQRKLISFSESGCSPFKWPHCSHVLWTNTRLPQWIQYSDSGEDYERGYPSWTHVARSGSTRGWKQVWARTLRYLVPVKFSEIPSVVSKKKPNMWKVYARQTRRIRLKWAAKNTRILH